MKQLFRIITSPFALMRIVLTGVAMLLASQTGRWFESALFGEIALFYTIAYGLSILAKGGGDAVFTRILQAERHRVKTLIQYLNASLMRLALAFVPVSALAISQFGYGFLEIIALVLLSVTIITGNALRISLSPNYQLGYDNSTFTIVALLVSTAIQTPVWFSGIILACSLGAGQWYIILKTKTSYPKIASPKQFMAPPYLIAELSYFTLGFATPAMISFVSNLDAVGVVRSIERIVFAGTFALFIINNRLFYDLSNEKKLEISFFMYFKKYCIPPFLFFLMVFLFLFFVSKFGLIEVISNNLNIFYMYSFCYLTSVICGPASGFLNFLGKENIVMYSSFIGAIIILLFFGFSIYKENYFFIIIGGVTGTVLTNFIQIYFLFKNLERKSLKGS